MENIRYPYLSIFENQSGNITIFYGLDSDDPGEVDVNHIVVRHEDLDLLIEALKQAKLGA